MHPANALIREARRRAGITQTELARRLDVSQPVVARLERSGANPRLLTLERAIAATGLSLQVTFGPPSGVDETLIASNLRLEPIERLHRFASAYRNVSTMARKARRSDGS